MNVMNSDKRQHDEESTECWCGQNHSGYTEDEKRVIEEEGLNIG